MRTGYRLGRCVLRPPDRRAPRYRGAVRRRWLAVATILLATGACSGGESPRSAAPTPTTAAGPSTTTVRRSQPYWTTVADLSGTGAATARPFTVDPVALQWRLTFHCSPGTTFSATGTIGTPAQSLRRPLATNAPCGGPDAEGQAFSGEIGTVTITVNATGAWDAKVEQQVDRPLVEPLPASLATARVVATGQFTKFDREGEGTVRVYRLADGSQAIRLEDFYTSINPDLGLMLSSRATFTTSAELQNAPSTEIALLKATLGSMTYAVPAGVDATTYKTVVIWSERAKSAFTVAALKIS